MARARKAKRSPVLEWISAGIGLVITLTLLGLLTFEAVRQRDGVPPLLDAEPVALTRAGDRYFVEIEVRNSSHLTGAAVQVEGTIKRGGEEVETSTTTVSYVPGESKRRAGLIFSHDPRDYQFELRVTGYQRP